MCRSPSVSISIRRQYTGVDKARLSEYDDTTLALTTPRQTATARVIPSEKASNGRGVAM
jgi:hypothetical protein